ncbi:hypothetical protein [Stakelama tenebrarum]|uniref:Alpha/beta hydrolase n=1 Tax=Stakelama tenebrarum TaxID=2711215 RepID=A0A6G6Y6Z6_9SPHN|nr:hypothetical protein [Sphingosinithalassobacter tenebrarum]QIG80695.1 hypothetical protein G5C33_13500 [Sphingosinithalassobacter tenebrarum]
MISHYDWTGGREAMLRFGPDTGPVIVAALPLFEEANRVRAFTVTILRALAERGVAGVLPDVPGQGESLDPTHTLTLARAREGFAAAAAVPLGEGRTVYGFAIRSGALLDGEAQLAGRWHFAPMTGADQLRELTRARQAAAREAGESFDAASLKTATEPVEMAGNFLSPLLLAEMPDAAPVTDGVRTVRLETDARPADHKIAGAPLWRRAEPDNDPALAELLADDIAQWVAACES